MKTSPSTPIGIHIIKQLGTSAWLWGAAATCGFYAVLPSIPIGQELLVRYCSSHPLEYIETGLFFVGLAIIVSKAIALRGERTALRRAPKFGPDEELSSFDTAVAHFQKEMTDVLASIQETYWGRRIEHLLAFFRGRKSGDGLPAQLTYLSEAEGDRLHNSHSLLQTVIWSIPILGFLGTVMGITLAIANVTPEQLDSSLNEVTGGLAVAFDTTALALTYSLVLGFASLFVKRAEESLLADIDETCRLEVHRCFPENAAHAHTLLEAEEQAGQLLIRETTALINRQSDLWNDSVETLRNNWSESVSRQQQEWTESLKSAADQSLAHHADHLAATRDSLSATYDALSSRLLSGVEQILQQRDDKTEQLIEQMQAALQDVAQAQRDQGERQQQHIEQILSGFAAQIDRWQQQADAWQDQVQTLSGSLAVQGESLLAHGAQLERIAGQEESLIRLQDSLQQNLETVRNAENFDQTLHNLNAAIHLLTARVRTRDAA